jgi:NADH-quinone oxidoreductase subunit C
MMESGTVFEKLTAKFGDRVLSTGLLHGEPLATVEKNAVHDILTFLKEDGDLSYDMLIELFAIDYMGENPRFEMVYMLRSTEHNGRVWIKTRIDEDGIDTASDIWNSANWLEREAFDMFGISFKKHPDLRRIYTDDDFEGYPLRKDFDVLGKDFDKPFIPNIEMAKE